MKSSTVAVDIFQQIDELEKLFEIQEARVLAFIPEQGRFDRLRKEAGSLLERYPRVEDRPPLFGFLTGVKDMFHVQGFITHAGSRLPTSVLQGPQAQSVSKLKDAGALIVGKTVTTEFAYFSPGPTRNPHNPEHTPGGSSSGSAAAVSAGISRVALGTQTIGSIIRPASFCGVFGLKPTYERISRDGVIPLSPSLDHIGFFTPDVATAKLVAPALYGEWDETIVVDEKPVLGIPEGPYLDAASDSARAWFGTICRSLAEAGYELQSVPVMPDYAEIRARHDTIMSAEAARVHKSWFEKYEELYAPKTAELIRRGRSVSEDQLAQALEERNNWRDEINALMLSSGIDLWISPATLGEAPKGLEATGDPVMNLPWTQSGLPALTLPAGKGPGGLPLGLQVTGRWSRDEAMLFWAEGLEMVLGRS
jgi:Asp-tRNA(Asn)/Glu-tRNA(Gln) amidotransferase A subunit family amidase